MGAAGSAYSNRQTAGGQLLEEIDCRSPQRRWAGRPARDVSGAFSDHGRPLDRRLATTSRLAVQWVKLFGDPLEVGTRVRPQRHVRPRRCNFGRTPDCL